MSNSLEKQTNRPDKQDHRKVIELSGVDVLTDVLNGLGLQSRLFCRSELTAPWGMSFDQSDLAHFHWIERGGGWLHCAEAFQQPLALSGGDLVVLPHGDAYHLSDQPGGKALPITQVLGGDGGDGRCRLLRHGGNGPMTSMLCGSFRFLREGFPLLSLLPAVLHVRGGNEAVQARLAPLMRALSIESENGQPGWQTIMTRLMDILFVQVIRLWLGEQPSDSHWLSALNDRQIHRALALMHEKPEYPWTLESLSRQVGLSRSPFAAKFARFVGEPPLTYLARLRIQRAARALRERKVPLIEAAQIAGYSSEIAFGRAFKRHMGITPGAYRTGHAA
jgi:AraC-like DNA-binding protein